ncbi:GbsR/MarR family transcriptional regulator [Fervidibacillus halotolerans]|uniref:HTH-type transcriptional regulator n=1 Tax=Fervidibacillus halotolerans TaxID=2980027 RepID=A0A9E8M0F6_9BACI|nr:GbsR/MarR family transcriptional regulator [Fervidibacillus halotolerans]WAA12906.1 GbsR/MarR family transcriptional regulator [Fervidibacillus halotolerans]
MNKEINEKLTDIEERIIDTFAENMRTYGIPPTVGRVLGIMYMNRKPMTLNDLSEATGMSKTRMSQVVREMVDYNIAYKVFEKGVRKDLYNVEQDYYQRFISLFSSSWQKVIKKNKKMGKKIYEELTEIQKNENLDSVTEEKIVALLKETERWLAYYDWLDRLMDFFESEEIFKYVPK